jgi:hypothetical protein
MMIVMGMYAVFAIMIFTGFVAEPSEVGLMLADQEKIIVNKEIELFSTEFTSNKPDREDIVLNPIQIDNPFAG